MGSGLSRVARGTSLGLGLAALWAEPSIAADTYLVAREFSKPLPGGGSVAMWGFAVDADSNLATVGAETPSSPGPAITVAPGDSTLRIHLRNDLGVPVSIVIPGQDGGVSPVKFTDSAGRERVQSLAAETGPGATRTYTWSGLDPGSYIYHSGTHPSVQVQMGLYGALRKNAAAGRAYDSAFDTTFVNEAVVFLSEIDPALHEAVANGTYGTADYPSTMDYAPRYFLVNGTALTSAAAPFITSAPINKRTLIRFFNAGLETHIPAMRDNYWSVISENGSPYGFASEQYSVLLPALGTADALLTPREYGTFPVYDRKLGLTNREAYPGGMVAIVEVARPSGAPAAVDDQYALDEDSSISVPAPGVLQNDSGGSSATLVQGAANGTLSLGSNGSFTYAPKPDFNGTEVFQYQASSGSLLSDTATVSLTVRPVNDPPMAHNDQATTLAGTPVVIDVLANDHDIDGDALTAGAVGGATNGTASVNADSTVTFTPQAGFTGPAGFRYRAADASLQSNEATVAVTVNPRPNTPPVAVDDAASTRMNTPIRVNVLANDTDADGNIASSTVAVATRPVMGGSAVANADGSITFRPRLYFRGTDVFQYTVKDADGAVSNSATVRVNVVR